MNGSWADIILPTVRMEDIFSIFFLRKKKIVNSDRVLCAPQMLMKGVDIRSILERLGHSSVSTTEIYTHPVKAMQGKILSRLDDM